MKRWMMTLGLLSLLSALIACGGSETTDVENASPGAARAPIPVQVEVRTAALTAVPQVTRATGSLQPLLRVSPGTKILGRIERVAFSEGDRVAKGALLAKLESRDLEAAVRQTEAAVRLAEAKLENAQAQRHRMVALHGRGSVTDKNLEDATAAFQVAEAALDQAQANLAATQVMLSYAEVRSPITGWVVEQHVEAGDMAAPGVPLFSIEDLSRIKVHVQVPEADIAGLHEGTPARVSVLDNTFEATIHRIVPAGDPASRTFAVKLLLDNPQGLFKSGMFARVQFDHGERRVLRVPQHALTHRGQLEGLFMASDDGLLRLRWVKTGRRDDGQAEILSGLEEGERYVAIPPPGLEDGTPYREVE